MDHGFFGMSFDFDHNGHLDALERAADFAAFMGIANTASVAEASRNDDPFIAGLDRDELELMDGWERREALEDAGLDPDDYDL